MYKLCTPVANVFLHSSRHYWHHSQRTMAQSSNLISIYILLHSVVYTSMMLSPLAWTSYFYISLTLADFSFFDTMTAVSIFSLGIGRCFSDAGQLCRVSKRLVAVHLWIDLRPSVYGALFICETLSQRVRVLPLCDLPPTDTPFCCFSRDWSAIYLIFLLA